jgi:hypothetical protein
VGVIHNNVLEYKQRNWTHVQERAPFTHKLVEMLQEVGNNVKHNFSELPKFDVKDDRFRFFLPFCFYTDSNIKLRNREDMRYTAKYDSKALNTIITELQSKGHMRKIFHVVTHPVSTYGTTQNAWERLIHNVRELRIDQTTMGTMSDIFIPVSTSKDICDYQRWVLGQVV